MISGIQSRADHERFHNLIVALLSSPTENVIREHLQDLSVPVPYRLRMKVLYSRVGPNVVFEKLARDGLIRTLSPNVPTYSLRSQTVDRRSHPSSVHFAVLSTTQESVRVVVSLSTYDQWRLFLRFARRNYPLLVPVLLSQHELIDGVLSLRAALPDFELRVKEVSARESLGNMSRKRARSIREWTDEVLRDALAHIADRRQIINSLILALHKRIGENIDISPSVLCKVTKQGEIEVTGKFRIAWSSVVAHFAEVGQRKLAFYSRRGLREREYRPAPLQIAFGTPVFRESTEVRRLVEVLSKYPHSMHSVQHGNPYLHVSVSDVLDGSSFDVWAVTGNAIAILPRLKASEAAIERLVHYVFDRFREGEVKELAHA